MSSRAWLVVGILSLSLVGCSVVGRFAPGGAPTSDPTKTDPTSPPAAIQSPAPVGLTMHDLDGRQFLSTLVTRNGKTLQLVSGTRIRIAFDGHNIGASAGCNSMSGEYRLEAGVVKVGMLATTEMGCDEPRMTQDTWLAAFLGSNPSLTLNTNEMVLATDNTTLQLLDREIAEPDQPLVGVTWGLTTILDADVASSVPGAAMATLLFSADGTVDVYTGCNSGGGHFTVDGDQITIDQLVQTAMACPGSAGEIEQAVLRVLKAGTLTYSIDAATLTLEADGHGLQYSAAIDV